VLLPACDLPLNIFEPRYLNMIDDALKAERLIGMVQKKSKNSDSVLTILRSMPISIMRSKRPKPCPNPGEVIGVH